MTHTQSGGITPNFSQPSFEGPYTAALKTFEACVRLGHFQKAAEELQYAPSTVTLQIQRLEADLGVSLFVRDGKRVVVTEAGRWLHHEASALLKSIGSMRQPSPISLMERTAPFISRLSSPSQARS
jgi:DNA-binding transcriptional LysR family regulator